MDRCGLARVVGWCCYRCRHWTAGAYDVFIVALVYRELYIGKSVHYPAARFSPHLTGYKAAVHGRGGGVWFYGGDWRNVNQSTRTTARRQ